MKLFPTSAALFLALFLTSELGATVIVADTFSGSGSSALNGTAATTFSSAITSAGGSGTWVAHSAYNANGTLTSTPSNTQSTSAILGLGSYIWDARGTANGQFTLTTTFSAVGGGSANLATRWISLGFFSAQPSTTQAFYSLGGMATIVHRQLDTGSSNYFPGPLTGGASDPGNLSGIVTFNITVDLRNWNGTNNWGSVTFSNSAIGGSTTVNLSNDSGANRFQYLGFTGNTDSSSVDGPSVTMTNFSLTQVPEPATAGLAALGLVTLFRRKRTA